MSSVPFDLPLLTPVSITSTTLHGVVAHLGPVKFSDKSDWVGIRLTTPSLNQGKNNGTVKGTFYFDAGGENNGCFVRSSQVERRTGMTRLEELKLKREIAQFKANIGKKPQHQDTGEKDEAANEPEVKSTLSNTPSPATPTASSSSSSSSSSSVKKSRLELLKEKRAALAAKQGQGVTTTRGRSKSPTPPAQTTTKISELKPEASPTPPLAPSPSPLPNPPSPPSSETIPLSNYTTLQSAHKTLQSTFATLSQNLTQTQSSLTEMKSVAEAQRLKIISLTSALEEKASAETNFDDGVIQDQLEEKDGKIKTLEMTIETMKEQRVKQTTNEAKQSANYQASINGLNREISAIRSETVKLEESLEAVTLEVEGLRQEKEELEDKNEELKLDLETMELELEEAREGEVEEDVTGGGGEDMVGKIKEDNRIMREALRKVREEMRKRERDREEEVRVEEGKREDIIKQHKEEIEELHKIVDGREATDEIIEGLTNRNLELEEVVCDFKAVKRELEERVEVGEEMEEVMGEEIKALKEEIEGWESKSKNLQEAVKRQREREKEGEKVVGKYKELVKKLREDVERMEDERRGEEGGMERRIDRERKAMETMTMWRRKEAEREGMVKELWNARIQKVGMRVEGEKSNWVPRTVAAMEHEAVEGDKTLSRTAAAAAYGIHTLLESLLEVDDDDRGGMEGFLKDVQVGGAMVDAHAECTRTIVGVGLAKGGGEDALEVSAASAHAFGEVYRLTVELVDKVNVKNVPIGSLNLLTEAVNHAREAINGDKDSNPMIEEEWNPEGWKQVRQASKTSLICKALEANFESTQEIQKLAVESNRLIESLSPASVFSESDADKLQQSSSELIEALKSSSNASPETSAAIENLTTTISECLSSLPMSPSVDSSSSPHPLLPTNVDAFASCVKYVDSLSSSNSWTRRNDKIKARILEGDGCRAQVDKITAELEKTEKSLRGKEKEATLLGKKIKQLEDLLSESSNVTSAESIDGETAEKLRKENAMLTEAMEVLHTQVDEYENEIRAMKGGRGRDKSPKKGKGTPMTPDGEREATIRAADATRPVLRAAIMDARVWKSKATKSMIAKLKPLGGGRRKRNVAQPQGGDLLELRRAEGHGGRDVREQLVKACCDVRTAKANCKVIEIGGGKNAAELARDAGREWKEAENRVKEAVEEVKWALSKFKLTGGGGKGGGDVEKEVLRARVKIPTGGGIVRRRHLLSGERDLERVLIKLTKAQ